MAGPAKAIDAWINTPVASTTSSERNVSYLFGDDTRPGAVTPAQLVEQMEAAGVGRGVLTVYDREDQMEWACAAIKEFPDRFVGSKVVDPRRGMEAVREIDRVAALGFRLIRMIAAFTQVPYNHASCYPIYSKCIELGLTVGVNVGIPGPRVPGRCQDPMDLDEVCYFYPELQMVMQHGGDPWADVCVKLLLKWPNLYYMTSAFAPKYYPPEIVAFLNSRGGDKVMWASDYPLLTWERCMKELADMTFRDDERREKFLWGNAERLFFQPSATDGQPVTGGAR